MIYSSAPGILGCAAGNRLRTPNFPNIPLGLRKKILFVSFFTTFVVMTSASGLAQADTGQPPPACVAATLADQRVIGKSILQMFPPAEPAEPKKEPLQRHTFVFDRRRSFTKKEHEDWASPTDDPDK